MSLVRTSILRNCFVILSRGILHKDSKNAIFLEPTLHGVFLNIGVSNYSEIRILDIRRLDRII